MVYITVILTDYKTNAGYYYGYYYLNDRYYYSCSSSATSLSQCSYIYYYYSTYKCGYYTKAFGVVCYDPSHGKGVFIVLFFIFFTFNITGSAACDNGDVRLINGQTDNEGRVEYCYSGAWSPVCQLDSTTASLMCKKLGYTQFKC